MSITTLCYVSCNPRSCKNNGLKSNRSLHCTLSFPLQLLFLTESDKSFEGKSLVGRPGLEAIVFIHTAAVGKLLRQVINYQYLPGRDEAGAQDEAIPQDLLASVYNYPMMNT